MMDTTKSSPPCLELVCQQLGVKVTRLQFQLRSDIHAQLLMPTDFTLDKSHNSPARCIFGSVTLLATASLFSLYMPHDFWPMNKLQKFGQAVRQ